MKLKTMERQQDRRDLHCEGLFNTGQAPGTHQSCSFTLFLHSWAEEREKINEGLMS